jgi:hypothetical protein
LASARLGVLTSSAHTNVASARGLLVRIAQREVRRRGPLLQITGHELDDPAHQPAADELVALT